MVITQEFDRGQFPSYENSNCSQLCNKQLPTHSPKPEPSRLPHNRKLCTKDAKVWRNPRWKTRKSIGPEVQQVNTHMWNDLAAKTYHAESDGRSITKTDNVGTNESFRSMWNLWAWKAKLWLWSMFWSYKAVYIHQNKAWAWEKIICLKVFICMKRLLLLNKYFFIKAKIPIIYLHL